MSILDLPKHIREKICVNPITGCWDWLAYKNPDGYGQLTFNGKPGLRAHTVVYTILKGPVPDGLQLNHKCKHKCVNPDHVYPGTHGDNIDDYYRDKGQPCQYQNVRQKLNLSAEN